jgi:SAM-dependent methyltransferase
VVGDCQERLAFPDQYFDRVLAIHVLEHLADLPAALAEVARVLKPEGRFSVVIPCEGGFGYSLGRRFTTKRTFEHRYKVPYDWIIKYEHINTAREVIAELQRVFSIDHSAFYPLRVPSIDLSIVAGFTLKPLNRGSSS